MRCVYLGTIIALAAAAGRGAEFHVHPDAVGGDGSSQRPWDLKTALAHPKAIRGGDTIWVHGGTYRGTFTSTLRGTENAQILVRAAPHERATIDCRAKAPNMDPLFSVQGQWTTFRDLEVTCSNPNRITTRGGSFPEDIRRGSVNCQGSNIRFINMIVHDLGNGFGFWSSGEGGEIYGCIIYNNGWKGPDRGHGHAIYTQNRTGTKRIVDNVMFNQFGWGIHAYGSSRAFLEGYDIEGNACFNSGSLNAPGSGAPNILVGAGSPGKRITVANNLTYHSRPNANVVLGYGALNEDIMISDNYFAGGVQIRLWKKAAFVGNFVSGGSLVDLEMPAEVNWSGYQWNGNAYVSERKRPFAVSREKKRSQLDWEEWRKSSGIDRASTLEPGRPMGVKVFVRPNKYEKGRAHVVVYNWDRKDEVEVDVSKVLREGQAFRVVSAQNYFGEAVKKGTHSGGLMSLPMKPIAAVKPVGMADFVPPVTEPEFGVYVIIGGD